MTGVSKDDNTRKSKSEWSVYFTRQDRNTCRCDICKCYVKACQGNTSNLRSHLQKHHRKEYAEIKERTGTSDSRSVQPGTSSQIDYDAAVPARKRKKMTHFVNPSIKWAENNPRKKSADHCLVQMICKDLQPVSIVEDEGFKSFINCLQPAYQLPTRRDLHCMIPDMYESVSIDILRDLSDIQSISLTTDYWTSLADDSYMSVTAHFLTPSFDVKDFCLNVSYLPLSHTAENISQEICCTVLKWFPDGNKINIYVVSDDVSNMVAASNLLPSNYQPLGCFAHRLQMVIKDSLRSFTGTQRMISKCRKIVGHFQHNALSTSKLKEMQTAMGLAPHKLKTECKTRWNSTYHMISRLVERKDPLEAVLASFSEVKNLTQSEWKLATEYVAILKPFEDATTIMSASRYSTVSMIIPILNTLIEKMNKSELDCFGEHVIANIKSRWPNYESNELYAITTCLDPRFKIVAFSDDEVKTTAQNILIYKLLAHLEQSSLFSLSVKEEPQQDECVSDQESDESKGRAVQDFWGFLRKKVEAEKEVDTREKRISRIKSEVDSFLYEKPIDPSACPFVWWKKNGKFYPNLANLARDFLCIPATSVASDRIFSKSGLVLSERRRRLKSTYTEKLVFLNHNLRQ